MRRWVIILIALVVVAGGVLGLALFNLNSFLADNREWIGQQLEEALGRPVSFTDLEVSFQGGVGAHISDLRIADDRAFAEGDFLRAADVYVAVRLIPALFGRIEAERVAVAAPSIVIIKEKQGFSFDSIGRPPRGGAGEAPSPAGAAPAPPSDTHDAEAPGAIARVHIARIEVTDATVRYVDRTVSPARDLTLNALDVSLRDVAMDRPIGVEIGAAILGSAHQNVMIGGEIGPLGSAADMAALPLDLAVTLDPVVLDDLRRQPGLAEAIPTALSAPDPITITANITGTPAAPSVQLGLYATAATLAWQKSFRKPARTPLRLDLTATRADDRVEIGSLTLRLADLTLKGKGRVTLGEPPRADLALASNATPLACWHRLLPAAAGFDVGGSATVQLQVRGPLGGATMPALSGTVTLSDVSARQDGSPYEITELTTTVTLADGGLTIAPTRLLLGGSSLEIEGGVPDLSDPALTFGLRSKGLALASLALAGDGLTNPEVLRDVEMGRWLKPGTPLPEFRGSIRSSGGVVRDVEYRNLVAELTVHEGAALLKTLALDAFDGAYRGSGRYDASDPARPQFDFRSSLNDMVLAELLGRFAPQAVDRIEGTLAADLQLAGAGTRWEQIREALSGGGTIAVHNGTLKDVNLVDEVLTSLTGIGGLDQLVSPRVRSKYPELFGSHDTRFDRLSGTIKIADGEARTDDLVVAARDYTITGKGVYELENRLDFTATLVLSAALSADLSQAAKELRYIADREGRLEIPFRLVGSPPELSPRPDREFLVRALARASVRRGLEELIGKPKEEKATGEAPPTGGATAKNPEKPDVEDAARDAGRELIERGLRGIFGR